LYVAAVCCPLSPEERRFSLGTNATASGSRQGPRSRRRHIVFLFAKSSALETTRDQLPSSVERGEGDERGQPWIVARSLRLARSAVRLRADCTRPLTVTHYYRK